MMNNETVDASNNAKGSMLLDVRNLSVDYYAASGTVHALDDVSITLERVQILGLAGESGSGKSTLAYAITRLLRPPAVITNGQILYYPRPSTESSITVQSIPRSKANANQADKAHADEHPVPIDILELTPAQLRAFRWNELSIVFQSAMNALNP